MGHKIYSKKFQLITFVTLACFLLSYILFNIRFINFHQDIFHLKGEFSLRNFFDNSSQDDSPFDKKWDVYLNELNLLEVRNIDDEKVLLAEPVIGTAISSNHVKEFLNLLKSLSSVYKEKWKHMVYVYDLGIDISEKEMLMTNYSDIIKEIRVFPFHKYPTYVQKLQSFRWKPIVVAELLKDFLSLWWMDASIIVSKPLSEIHNIYHGCSSDVRTCPYYPWTLLKENQHSIYSATDSRMYNYLPFPIDESKTLDMYAATVQLIFATKHVRENVLRYWVLCALQEECMDPSGTMLRCYFGENKFTDYANCHRQDQSAINIILARVNNFNSTRYHFKDVNNILRIAKTDFLNNQ